MGYYLAGMGEATRRSETETGIESGGLTQTPGRCFEVTIRRPLEPRQNFAARSNFAPASWTAAALCRSRSVGQNGKAAEGCRSPGPRGSFESPFLSIAADFLNPAN